MSATNLVDLAGLPAPIVSIAPAAGVGSTPASGVVIGGVCDMRYFHNATSLVAFFGPSISGQFRLQVQTSDATTSGSFTDPTSGMPVMPTNFVSGGILVVNSGNAQRSGGVYFGTFLRPHRYCRANILGSDEHDAPAGASFWAQSRRTGSGDGYTFSPALGTSGGYQGIGGF